MNERTNEGVNEWMNEWMDEWTNECINLTTPHLTSCNEWKSKLMNESVNQFDDADRVSEKVACIKQMKTKSHFAILLDTHIMNPITDSPKRMFPFLLFVRIVPLVRIAYKIPFVWRSAAKGSWRGSWRYRRRRRCRWRRWRPRRISGSFDVGVTSSPRQCGRGGCWRVSSAPLPGFGISAASSYYSSSSCSSSYSSSSSSRSSSWTVCTFTSSIP